MKLTKDILKQILQVIAATRSEEITCDECFDRLDQFTEQVLEGKEAEKAMPLIQDHLDRCSTCQDEFEALLEILRATTD